MEENINIEISETNQGKEQNINYFSFRNIYNSKVHRSSEYKIFNKMYIFYYFKQ